MKTKTVRAIEVCDGCGDKHPRGTLRRDTKDASLLYCDNCPKLTAEQVQEHLDSGFYCPFCADGRTQYTVSDFDPFTNHISATAVCTKDGDHVWKEYYKLYSITHPRVREEDEDGISKE